MLAAANQKSWALYFKDNGNRCIASVDTTTDVWSFSDKKRPGKGITGPRDLKSYALTTESLGLIVISSKLGLINAS